MDELLDLELSLRGLGNAGYLANCAPLLALMPPLRLSPIDQIRLRRH